MKDTVLIMPRCRNEERTLRLQKIIENGMAPYVYEVIDAADKLAAADLRNRRLLFAISLGESGINLEFYAMLKKIRTCEGLFEGSIGGIIVDGMSELFTKSVARELAFSANRAGCTFPGTPLIEGTGTLYNFNIIAKNLSTDNMEAYLRSGRNLIRRVMEFQRPEAISAPNLLALHAGNLECSNTLDLWSMVKESLSGFQINEISLRNGEIRDCIGCDYETCLHFGERQRCFYGGVITREVYPAIMECDGLVMLCANYNDAISAYLSAFINRMTSLFRVHRFDQKRLYAVVVSGYSGSDIVAQQLIAGLNMNKSFFLPPRFALMETANDPGSILKLEGIPARARVFGESIAAEFKTCKTTQR